MKHFSIIVTCLFALILSTTVLAQNPTERGNKRGGRNRSSKLKKMDANQDGQITRDEWKGQVRGFQKADRNNDGVINSEEVLAGGRKFGKRQLKRMDTDKNRQITRGEWSGDSESFNKFDKNNDGVLTRQEIKRHKRNG